jgi:phosphohistidine phosphatase
MTKILLIRHASAVDQGELRDDESRWLDAGGREVARRVGARLAADGITFDKLVTSPLVRAVQTADLVAEGYGWPEVIEVVTALSPNHSPRSCAAQLVSIGGIVAAVGHEPSISGTAAILTGRPSFPSFKKGQATLIADGKVVATVDPDAT